LAAFFGWAKGAVILQAMQVANHPPNRQTQISPAKSKGCISRQVS